MNEIDRRLRRLEADVEMIVERVRDTARFRSAEDMVTKSQMNSDLVDLYERLGEHEERCEACLDYFRDIYGGGRLDKRLKKIEEDAYVASVGAIGNEAGINDLNKNVAKGDKIVGKKRKGNK